MALIRRERRASVIPRQRVPGSTHSKVVRFPPLPPIPAAPSSRLDVRQKRFQEFIGRFAGAVGDRRTVATINSVSGFHASAVDVGKLKTALERGIASFDMRQVRMRWNEVFAWMRNTIREWSFSNPLASRADSMVSG